MRFFIFSIWVLSYGLPILPAGMLFSNSFPLNNLPSEVMFLLVLPGSLYIILHSIKNRQGFNFIKANFLNGLPPTIALFGISLQPSLLQYAYSFLLLSCIIVLIIWWNYPYNKSRIF
ncbi:hypothetical protein [Chryseotalea sanaruensis]|uniref:hypothetical protein n=1 Tax=Chryseotalea sanaruensis TaxID=2482724 RepID=UPI001359C18D|nr:hypothetical protein [Chryseotalea sanaruensis]